MKNKKKHGPEPTVTSIFDGEMSFHNTFDHIWVYGLAVMGKAQESFEEAAAAFEQLYQLQSLSDYLSSPSDTESWLKITWPATFEHLQAGAGRLCAVPVLAGVLWGIYEPHKEKESAKALLRQYYPSLLNFQRTLYNRRDPNADGLITNIHPWETGQGSSERWRELTEHLLQSTGVSLEPTEPDQLSPFLFQSYQLFHQLVSGNSEKQEPFRVQDPFFHAFLSWNNESLIKMGAALEQDVQEVIEWYELSTYSINEKLWNTESHRYCPYDENAARHLPIDLLESAVCLFSETATQDLAEQMYPHLEKRLKKAFSLKIRATEQHPLAVARQILLFQSLQSYGFDELSIQLLQRLGVVLQQADQNSEKKQDFLWKGLWSFLNR